MERAQDKRYRYEFTGLNCKANRGFSFIEILVCAAILIFLITAVFVVLQVGDITWDVDKDLVDLQDSARRAMDAMVREVRNARAGDVLITQDGKKLTLDFIYLDLNGKISQEISYYRENDQLIREHPAAKKKPIANYISDLSFCCWRNNACDNNCKRAEDGILQIQLWAEKTYMQRTLQAYLNEKIVLRNK